MLFHLHGMSSFERFVFTLPHVLMAPVVVAKTGHSATDAKQVAALRLRCWVDSVGYRGTHFSPRPLSCVASEQMRVRLCSRELACHG